MRFKNTRKKFTVFFVGIITSLLLLEICLRIIGIISLRKFDKQLAGNRYGDSYIILCLGDSFTYGTGAAYGMDYPSQLEVMLNSRAIKKRFKVINRGMGNYNTTLILNELKNTLEKGIRPDLVTFLGGGANYWNYTGYQVYLKGSTFASIINDYLYRIRIFKLAKLLFLNIKDKIKDKLLARKINNYLFLNTMVDNEGENNNKGSNKEDIRERLIDNINYYGKGKFYSAQSQYDEAIKWLKRGIEVNPNDTRCYAELGSAYKEKGQYDEAIKWLKRGIEVNPNDTRCYVKLAISYERQKDTKKALEYFKKSIKLDPTNIRIYYDLFNIYMNPSHVLTIDKDVIEFLNELAENHAVPAGFIDILNQINNKRDITEEVREWILSDIERIIKICKENGIKILLQDYPNDLAMSDLLYKIAKVNSVPFVSNYQISHNLENRGEGINDYFVSDGHCSAKGYALIARNIFDKIIQEKMFDE